MLDFYRALGSNDCHRQAQRRSSFEERLHEIERSRDDLQMTLTKVMGEKSNLAIELDLAKRTISELQQVGDDGLVVLMVVVMMMAMMAMITKLMMMLQELILKQREKMEEISKLRSEAANRIKDLEQEVRTRDGKLKGHIDYHHHHHNQKLSW